jgi:glycosyltransferase involved in cell wall biosynthesis
MVTIVITTHDRGPIAQRALRCALDQTYGDTEILVVDDGSKEPFAPEHHDPRVSVIRLDPAHGVCAARNVGLSRATGTWITFLDDDDEISPRFLELSLEAAASSSLPPPVAVVSGIAIIDPEGAPLTARIPVASPRGSHYFLEGAPDGQSFTVGNTLVIDTETMREIGGFDEKLRSAVHSELFLRVNEKCSIEAVPYASYSINRHHGQNVHGNVLERARSMERTAAKHETKFAAHPKRYARYLSAAGIAYLRAGYWGPALRLTTRAMRIAPWDRRVVRSWVVTLVGPTPLRARRRIAHLKRVASNP